jgi:hypothetical protein
MAGLISSGISTKKPEDFLASGYDPSLRTVDPEKETVSGRLDAILGKDNPYITRARAGAAQTANSRGLLNSSIAAGAGEAAAIDAALPIAGADASTYGTAARENQAAKNTAGQFNAGAQNQFGLQAQSGLIQSGLSGQASEQAKEQARLGAELETGALIPARTEAAKTLAEQGGKIQSQLSAQQAAQTGTLATQAGDIQAKLAKIDADLKAGLISVDAAEKAKLAAQAGQIQTGLIGATGEQTRLTQAESGQIQARIAELQAQLQTGLIGAEGAQTRMTTAQAQAAQKELLQLQGQIETGIIGARGEEERATAELRGQIETGLQQLRGTQSETLANIEANYKMLMQSSASSAQLYQESMRNISTILNDPDTSVDQKQNAVNNQLVMLNSGMGIIGGISNLDLTGLLSFGPPPAGGTTGGTPVGGVPGFPGVGGITPVPPDQPAPGGTYYNDAAGGRYYEVNGNIYSVGADGSLTFFRTVTEEGG